MKKQKPKKIQPLFRREKDMYKLLADPNGMAKVMQLTEVADKMKASADKLNERAKDLTEWHIRVCSILPEELKDNQAIKMDIANLVEKYDNKSE